jgi:glycosyltransferase involved in cell wall biosynthesis
LKLSVIVPVLNEAEGIGAFVAHLRARLPEAEVIVVDGGSEDATCHDLEAMREKFSLRILRAPRARASQMNAGAAVATGDALLFLHADSRLPRDCGRLMDDLPANPA